MVFEKVVEVIADITGKNPDGITMESHLVDDLDLDSLDAVEIVMALEDEYSVSVPDDDMEQFKTVGDIVEYVEKMLD